MSICLLRIKRRLREYINNQYINKKEKILDKFLVKNLDQKERERERVRVYIEKRTKDRS